MRFRYLLLLAGFLNTSFALAHGVVGNRMFIEPLFTEDANVKNEFVMPFGKFGVQQDGTWREFSFSFEKQLYPGVLSVVLEGGRVNRHDGPDRLAGWDNLEIGVKWEAFTNEPREFVLTPALFVTVPAGSEHVVEHETALRPMLLYGKGFGDLPLKLLRPFAVQGDIGIGASVREPFDKDFQYDTVLMYSIPYLNHWVRKADARYSIEGSLRRGFSRGALLGNLFPFVEFNGIRPVNGDSQEVSSSLRPGILWMGKYVQVSVAADIPIQHPRFGDRPHRGVCFSFDWFLDEILPRMDWTPFGRRAHHP